MATHLWRPTMRTGSSPKCSVNGLLEQPGKYLDHKHPEVQGFTALNAAETQQLEDDTDGMIAGHRHWNLQQAAIAYIRWGVAQLRILRSLKVGPDPIREQRCIEGSKYHLGGPVEVAKFSTHGMHLSFLDD